MLNSLKDYSKSDAQDFLAAVTASLLPKPSIDSNGNLPRGDKDLYRQVLAESRQRLNLSADDESREATSRLLEFLGDQISEAVLNGANVHSIKARLGASGSLRPDQYDIQLKPFFREVMAYLHVTEAEVYETLASPHDVEHFHTEAQADRMEMRMSLYMRNFGSGEDRHVLLIVSKREGANQLPSSVWRVFYSDVDLRAARSPLDVLRSFADVYGISFRIGDARPAKLHLREVVPVPPNLSPKDMLSRYAFTDIPESFHDGTFARSMRFSPLGAVIFEFAFCVDMLRYRGDFEKHGYKIAPKRRVGLSGVI